MAAILTVWNKDFRNFRYLNTAFITLLPKKEDAILAKDFRPISLIHSFAKLITKVMANRLSGYVDKLISKNQSAFIKGKFIQDNFMLVQQTARLLHAQN
jgi:ribosomal protein S17E